MNNETFPALWNSEAPVKLYASPLACSGAVQIVMFELEIPHTLEFVDIYAQPHVVLSSGAVYKEVNPKDAVPALVLSSGDMVTEVGVILQLLCDGSAETTLLPRPGSRDRYRVMEWLSYVGSEVHKTIGPLFHPLIPEAAKAIHRQNLHRRLSTIEQRLATSPFLAGAHFTVADAYLAVMIGWEPYFKVWLGPYPHLRRYHQGIVKRPSFQRMREVINPVLGSLRLPAFPDHAREHAVG